MMRNFMLALQFMTIIPVRVRGVVTEKEMAGSTAFFPVVGMLQGFIAAIAAFIFLKFFPADIAGGLLIALMSVISGGFHLDGLMDTFDALGVKSSGDAQAVREKRLSVMKDSRAGAMGVVAVTIILLLKFLCTVRLLEDNYLYLFLMPVLSKWAMVVSLFLGRPARSSGLGRIFAEGTGAKEMTLSSVGLVLAFVIYHAAAGPQMKDSIFALYGILIITALAFSIGSLAFFKNRFGGITGDTLGAAGEMTEILCLLAVILWSRLSI